MKKSVVTKKMVLKDAKNAPALVELQKARITLSSSSLPREKKEE